nr:MAG TPA: hypothetical protein [Caudoviricetes sp.]
MARRVLLASCNDYPSAVKFRNRSRGNVKLIAG